MYGFVLLAVLRFLPVTNFNPFSLRLDKLSPVYTPETKGERGKAAVLIALIDQGSDTEIIYTRRADHLNSHAGQVSFPGGMWEPEDDDLAATALRESEEEIGLHRALPQVLGAAPVRPSKNGVEVLPVVAILNEVPSLQANADEIADIFRVPIRWFYENAPTYVDVLARQKKSFRVPAWDYQGFDIWGLTAVFTYELLWRMNIPINLQNSPERHLHT